MKEIAYELNVAADTVAKQKYRIMKTLNRQEHCRAGAIRDQKSYYCYIGFLSPDSGLAG